MDIPIFKPKTLPVLLIEENINEEASEEEKQFKLIHDSIKEFECLPTVEEMAAILDYERKALNYAYELAIYTLDNRSFEREFVSIYNAVNDSDFYSIALKNEIVYIKYCALQKVLGEINVIHKIKDDLREINFNYNYHRHQTLQAIQGLKPEWLIKIIIQ